MDLPVAVRCFWKRSGDMTLRGEFFGGLTIGLIAISISRAQELPSTGSDFSQAIQQAADNFRPIAAQDVAREREKLAKAMGDLDAFLKTGARIKSDGWKAYLKWNELLGALK